MLGQSKRVQEAFVRWTVPQKLPILHDGYSSYGFLHRLDVARKAPSGCSVTFPLF